MTKIDDIDRITINIIEDANIKGYFRCPKYPEAIPYKRVEIVKASRYQLFSIIESITGWTFKRWGKVLHIHTL